MSQQQKKEEFSEKLMISASGQLSASQKIPQIARPFVSERALKFLDVVCCLIYPLHSTNLTPT